MPVLDTINRAFRDFVRFTGDGKPNAPVGAPLPIGDPRSGLHNLDKAEMRQALIEVAQTQGDPEALQNILAELSGKADTSALSTETESRIQAQDELQDELDAVEDHLSSFPKFSAGNGFAVIDDYGWTGFLVGLDGEIKTSRVSLGTGDELIVVDPYGFVGFRVSSEGSYLFGIGSSDLDADEIASSLRQAEYLNSGIYRPAEARMPHFRRARAAALAGTGQCKILFIGDSISGGYATDGPGVNGSRREHSAAHLLSRYLTGIPSSAMAIAGSNGYETTADFTTYWSAVTAGAGWGFGGWSLGNLWTNSSTNNPLEITPSKIWDRVEVVTASPVAAQISINGTPYSIPGGALHKIVHSVPRGQVACVIARLSGDVQIASIQLMDSQTPAILIATCGRNGGQSQSWSSSAEFYSPLNVLPFFNADLYVVELGVNDIRGSVSPALYQSRMRSIILACKLAGDVLLVSSIRPTGPGIVLSWNDYVVALRELSDELSVPMIDLAVRFGEETDGMMTDPLHPNASGQADRAIALAQYLQNT